MNRSEIFSRFTALALVGVFTVAPAWAQMDVDQADSLNFQGFHKDKKAAIKVWKDGEETAQKNGPVKVYEQTSPVASSPAAAQTAVPRTVAESAPAIAGTNDNHGKRFEIRERYSLTRSASTPYSAFFVIEALHQQMAALCPAGWEKIAERSEPIEQDFYLYYELQCL